MNPFYFGRSERPLFGLFTRGQSTASAGAASGRAVLLCHPIGSEYMRAHRAFRQLTTLLNRAGLDVLRFDYSGTGDSAGDGDEATFDDWLDDVDWAIDELMDTAGVDTLDVVGLRWGATLAALAARSRDEIRHLVLWDPVVSGASYLEEVLPHPCPQGTVGIEGYPFSASLRAGLEGIDLRQSLRRHARRQREDHAAALAFAKARDDADRRQARRYVRQAVAFPEGVAGNVAALSESGSGRERDDRRERKSDGTHGGPLLG